MNFFIIVLFCLFSLFQGCSSSPSQPPSLSIPQEELSPFIQKWASRKGFEQIHRGEESREGDAQLHLHFIVRDSLKLEEGRKLFLELVQEALLLIENHSKKNDSPEALLDISLTFRTSEDQPPSREHVAHAYLYDGVFYYSYYDEELQKLRKLHMEKFKDTPLSKDKGN